MRFADRSKACTVRKVETDDQGHYVLHTWHPQWGGYGGHSEVLRWK